MLHIDVVTLFPEMIENALSYGVLGQAIKGHQLSVNTHTPREFAIDRHRTVDDRPFGGGDGMIMLAETLEKTILKVKQATSKVIYLSPQGKTLNNSKVRELSNEQHLIFLSGRYGGIDQRIINSYVDEEISIGDYVLSGGELGALVIIDALARFIPGVLGNQDSADKDSFEGGILECPHFTRPKDYLGQEVPPILLSGNHQLIEDWRQKVAALVTMKKRPDLFAQYISIENHKYQEQRQQKKKVGPPLEVLRKFFYNLSEHEKQALGLHDLSEEDLHG